MNAIKKIHLLYSGKLAVAGVLSLKIYEYKDKSLLRLMFCTSYVLKDYCNYYKLSIANIFRFKNYYIGKYFKKNDINNLSFFVGAPLDKYEWMAAETKFRVDYIVYIESGEMPINIRKDYIIHNRMLIPKDFFYRYYI